jgi:hypothetical protein
MFSIRYPAGRVPGVYVCTPYTSKSGHKALPSRTQTGDTQRDKRVRDKRLKSRVKS